MSAGTGVSGVKGGFFECHDVACSYAAARAKTFDSEKCGPQIIKPMGSPSLLNPQGTVMEGMP
jgi:hypothetical protein